MQDTEHLHQPKDAASSYLRHHRRPYCFVTFKSAILASDLQEVTFPERLLSLSLKNHPVPGTYLCLSPFSGLEKPLHQALLLSHLWGGHWVISSWRFGTKIPWVKALVSQSNSIETRLTDHRVNVVLTFQGKASSLLEWLYHFTWSNKL